MNDIPPKLTVASTLCHPAEDIRVVGFRGRDINYGHDALILKGAELPTSRDGPAVTQFFIPEKQASEVLGGDVLCYILDEHTVYRASDRHMETARKGEMDSHGVTIRGRHLFVDGLTTWPRTQVEVN